MDATVLKLGIWTTILHILEHHSLQVDCQTKWKVCGHHHDIFRSRGCLLLQILEFSCKLKGLGLCFRIPNLGI